MSNLQSRRPSSLTPFSVYLILLFLLLRGCVPNSGDEQREYHVENDINPHLLKDVLQVIKEDQNWTESPSKLKLTDLQYGNSRRYKFRVQLGKTSKVQASLSFPDKVDPRSWSRLDSHVSSSGTRLSLADLAQHLGQTNASLDTFRIQGPFDLQVLAADRLSLLLPMNVSHFGLKRVIVNQGIVIELNNAREVSFLQPLYKKFSGNGSSQAHYQRKNIGFCPFCVSTCSPLLPLAVVGSATLSAYWSFSPTSSVKTAFLSADTIELLPNKCYLNGEMDLPAQPVHSLSQSLTRLEQVITKISGTDMSDNGVLGYVKVVLKASYVLKFVLKLERNITHHENYEKEEWRSRPDVEHKWFEVIVRVEDEKLEPLAIKVIKPFNSVDTMSWSTFMTNISFSKLLSVSVPPDFLTLDV